MPSTSATKYDKKARRNTQQGVVGARSRTLPHPMGGDTPTGHTQASDGSCGAIKPKLCHPGLAVVPASTEFFNNTNPNPDTTTAAKLDEFQSKMRLSAIDRETMNSNMRRSKRLAELNRVYTTFINLADLEDAHLERKMFINSNIF